VPNFGVAAVVFRGGDVLLVKREDAETWTVPGGAIEDGESLATAAAREVLEESGIEARLTSLVGLYSRPGFSRHMVVFAGEAVGGELRPQPGEALDAGFFAPNVLPDPLLWWFRQPIADAVAGRSGQVWTQNAVWTLPFDPNDRAALYAEVRSSGLSKADFYRRHLTHVGPGGERRDLPPP
jgi:ADP-ribose pyrophosphatase YjhB (NUDIX family)